MANYVLSGYTTPSGISRRNDVRSVQQQLNAYGAGLKTDGIWGPKTQAAYNSYQQQSARQNQLNNIMSGLQSYSPGSNLSASYDAAAASYKQALDAAYESQKAGLQSQAAALADQYNQVRKQAYVNSRLNAIGNNEVLAAQGLAGNLYDAAQSGASETSRIAQNVGMRNDINAATRQENAERDKIALEILQSGYTRDVEYAKYLAEIQIMKAQAEAQAAQQAFQNQLAIAQMQMSMMDQYGGISLGNSYGSGSRGGRSGSSGSSNNNNNYKLLNEMDYSTAYENMLAQNTAKKYGRSS